MAKTPLRSKVTPVVNPNVGVIIGRFQVHELHKAHKALIKSVYDTHDRTIIILGLSPCVGTRSNPLDFEARRAMLQAEFPDLTVAYAPDMRDDKKWSDQIDKVVDGVTNPMDIICLYGGRDSFIKVYTGKHSVQELESDSFHFISGTEIRNGISRKVKGTADFRAGVIWAAYNQYPKCYATVDVAIMREYDGKRELLLVRKPHEEKYRFTGGFSSPDSPSYEADVRREVAEEVGIEIDDIRYVTSALIDDWRYRGEVDKIKTLFYTATYTYGRPSGADDVCEARWFDATSYKDLEPHVMHEHLPLLDKLFYQLNFSK